MQRKVNFTKLNILIFNLLVSNDGLENNKINSMASIDRKYGHRKIKLFS